MSATERILLLLRIAGATGISPAVIGDICQVASHLLEPIIRRLVDQGEIVGVFDDGFTRRRRCYRLATEADTAEDDAPIAAPAWRHRHRVVGRAGVAA